MYELPEDPANTPRSLYLHVPFCLHRCGYCDFTLVADRDDLIPTWFEALGNELQTLPRRVELDTLFVGGGTPSHLSPEQLLQLGTLIHQHFDIAAGAEFSLEANPDGLDEQRLAAIAAMGVKRLSLGVQSFDSAALSLLERQHAPDEAVAAIERAAKFFDNISLDLIFGVPGQDLAAWQQTLNTATSLPVRHISTYGLTFEKGTAFYRRRQHGDLHQVPDELEREMYATAIDRLRDAGFAQYEISNFAKPGFACRHNITYWQAAEYLAFGPGGARYVSGVRSTNSRNVRRWIEAWQKQTPALQDVEQLDAEGRAREAVFVGLRMNEGVDLMELSTRFGCDLRTLCAEAIDSNSTAGLLQIDGERVRLTREGRFVADSVVTDFL